MEKLSDITLSIDAKLAKLIRHLEKVVAENSLLKEELELQKTQYTDLQKQHEALKSNHEQLKFANSLLGSEDFKKETKLKINSLVREIDHCISQLNNMNN